MHSSLPNRSNSRRMAIIGRYVRPSTKIYPYRWQGDFIDENAHNIKRHFNILVSGRDDYGYNVVRDGHDLDETEVEFQLMSNLVRYGRVEVPEDKHKLDISGLEKQAIEGDCQEEEPNPILHPRKYIEWQAWNQYQGMSCTEAMKRYSQLITTLPQKDNKVSTHNSAKVGERDKDLVMAAEIESWLVSYLADLLETDPDEVEVTIPFESYGLSSSESIGMLGDLGDWLGDDLKPTLLYNYPTIEAVALYLAEGSALKKQVSR